MLLPLSTLLLTSCGLGPGAWEPFPAVSRRSCSMMSMGALVIVAARLMGVAMLMPKMVWLS